MQKNILKHSLIAGLCVAASGLANTASAHDLPGTLTSGLLNGKGSGVTDVYQIVCALDTTLSTLPTDHLFLEVRDDSTAGGQVSATAMLNSLVDNGIVNNLSSAVSVTDTIPADGLYSTSRILKAPAPAQDLTFTIFVHHTLAATDSYLLTTHCQDVNSQHTGTTGSQLQDQ